MKIVIVGSAYPLRGGIATFVERMASFLMEEGHDVTIFSYSLQYPNILFPGKTQYSDEAPNAQLNIKTRISTLNPLNWLKVGIELKNLKPDLIIVKYWMPFFAPSLGTIFNKVKKNNHTKIIAILDNVLPHEKKIGDKALTRYFLNSISGGVAMSRSVLDDLKTLKKNLPAIYTPHPMYDNYGSAINRNEALSSLGLDTDKQYVLFFGFIRKYKGLDLLLEAFGNHQLKASNIELIVAGEYYGDEAYYKNIISTLNIQAKVHIFDTFIPNAEVRRYFSASDAVVQPYRTATQSGISQIAYHFDKPMVVTNVGGLPEIVPDGKAGYVVDPNPDAIADAILRLFQPGTLENMRLGLAEEKKKYEWDTFIEQIFELSKGK